MNTLVVELQNARARSVQVTEEALIVELADGRTISVPLAWYPRLWYGTSKERENFEIIGEGEYIHWPDLDEDLSVIGILTGRKPKENPDSFKKWLAARG